MVNKYLASFLVPLALFLGGESKKNNIEQNPRTGIVSLTGRPISVDKIRPNLNNDNFYIVLETDYGKRLYLESLSTMESSPLIRKAYALFKAEKEDGDNESVNLVAKRIGAGIDKGPGVYKESDGYFKIIRYHIQNEKDSLQ